MQTRCIVLIAITLFAVTASADELKIVIETFRHGARAPISEAFEDPSGIMDYEVGLGNLTPTGMRMHYLLGTELRKRFVDDTGFLSARFDQSEIYVRSTDTNRTIQSVESQLMGLFPLGTGPTLKNVAVADLAVPPMTVRDLHKQQAMLGLDALPGQYQPVPVNTIPRLDDFMLSSWAGGCARIQQLKNVALQTDATKAYLEEHVYPLLPELSQHTGISVEQLKDPQVMVNAYSELNCGYFNGKPLPEGVDGAYVAKLQPIAVFFFYYYYFGTDEATKLGSSEFFLEINKLVNDSVAGESNIKLALFSAHDITLSNFMRGMGQEYLYPDFAANILFEVYRKSGTPEDSKDLTDYYMKTIFNNTELLLPGCSSTKCELTTVLDYFTSYSITDVPAACAATSENTPEVGERYFLAPY